MQKEKLNAQGETIVEKESEFNVDLRSEEVTPDVILKDEERMGEIQKVVEN